MEITYRGVTVKIEERQDAPRGSTIAGLGGPPKMPVLHAAFYARFPKHGLWPLKARTYEDAEKEIQSLIDRRLADPPQDDA